MSKKIKTAMCNWCRATRDVRQLRYNAVGEMICRAGVECDKRHRTLEVKR